MLILKEQNIGINKLHFKTMISQLKNASDIAKEISNMAYEILCDEWGESIPIRMLTVTVSGLVEASSSYTQLDLFSSGEDLPRDKDKKREETVDKIRRKFGSDAISSGALYDTDIGVGVKKR